MKIAFAIVDLFPGGGLQRECIKLARALSVRGHEVTLFAERRWGLLSEDLNIHLLKNYAYSNHRRQLQFADDVVQNCKTKFDLLVGFGVLKGLDVLYCADPSFALRRRTFISRLTGRYDTFVALEGASFAPGQETRCLLLSEQQLSAYQRAWKTEASRLKLIPPYIDIRRRQPEFRVNGVRDKIRAELGFSAEDFVWLAVAGQPKVKGLDRTLLAMREFPDAHLMIAGLEPHSKRTRFIRAWAKKNQKLDHIKFLGFRDDIPELMSAADVLVHPARQDTTGGVILEGLINGLPVITTNECGYAIHVTKSQSGVVLQSPFDIRELISALHASGSQRANWSANGVLYGQTANLYSGVDRAADYIEEYRRPYSATYI